MEPCFLATELNCTNHPTIGFSQISYLPIIVSTVFFSFIRFNSYNLNNDELKTILFINKEIKIKIVNIVEEINYIAI